MIHTVHDRSARLNLRLVLAAALLAGVLGTLINVLIWFMLRGEFDAVLVRRSGALLADRRARGGRRLRPNRTLHPRP